GAGARPRPGPGLAASPEEVAARPPANPGPAGGGGRPPPPAEPIRRLVLPHDRVGPTVDRGERAAHLRADRRRLRAADVALAELERVAEPRERARAHRAGNVEIARVGAVRNR